MTCHRRCSVDCLPALVRMTARLSSARMSKEPVALDEPGLKRLVADCDEAMVMLLQERAKAQVMLAELKGPGSGPTSAELTGDELDRIERANAACNDSVTPALSIQAVRSVFQEIARGCSQLRCTVAYLGPPATFTHQASRSHFGMNADYVQCDRIPDVFSAVERGKVEWGVAPVENSTEGSVSQTLDLLATTELQVVAEVCLDIRHNLLSHAEIHNVQKVFSHPQALAQSRGWLQTHCPGAQIISESSTARSAELASGAKPEEGVAAVASLLASELYGVAVKAQGIQDLTSNMTRFVIFKQVSPTTYARARTRIGNRRQRGCGRGVGGAWRCLRAAGVTRPCKHADARGVHVAEIQRTCPGNTADWRRQNDAGAMHGRPRRRPS